jgi:hypothetical protein
LCVFLVTGKDTHCILFVKYLSIMYVKKYKWLLINGIHLCFAAYLWIRVRLFPVHRVSCPGSRASRQLLLVRLTQEGTICSVRACEDFRFRRT